jgi:hypothetical protein
MAYIILQNNEIHRIAKTEANMSTIIPNLRFYQDRNWVRDITDQEFSDLNLGRKIVDTITDSSVTFKDPFVPLVDNRFAADAETLSADIPVKIEILEKNLSKMKFGDNTAFENEIKDYKTILENLDVSSWTYPMTKTLEEYIQDNSLGTPICPLQLYC